ncbi:hypothetical protein NQ317_009056 [Molorchus minor]|uniref:Mitochondrial carrier protein n=1 Tax=Molorchus minor TaxID=1323400 RepID=A0ABQ9J0Z0_9CUCU|nr:hypothetical protein NQ317_009056 [Molorchus minor]
MPNSGLLLLPAFNWREFACGWGAAFVNVTVTYPVNKLIFRQMLHGVKAHHAFQQLKDEEVRRPLTDSGYNHYAAKAIGALASGTTEAVLMPFERVQTLLADAKYHDKFKNTMHAFKILRNYGYGEYYRDELQCRIPKYENELVRTITEFICGAMIGVFLSSLFYPLNVLKVAMQSKVGGPYENPLKVLLHVYRERGGKIQYIYHGVHANCTRAFLSWGVMNTAYEHLKALVY